MPIDNVADLIVETLIQAGVKRIYGVVGDSLNGSDRGAAQAAAPSNGSMSGTRRWRRSPPPVRPQMTGGLAVCAGSCGPGNLHLINGLFDAHRSRVPVLAIAAQIPSAEIGGGYFQETHPQKPVPGMQPLLRAGVRPGQLPYVLENAIRAAVGKRGVAVIVDARRRRAARRRPSARSPRHAGLLPVAAPKSCRPSR